MGFKPEMLMDAVINFDTDESYHLILCADQEVAMGRAKYDKKARKYHFRDYPKIQLEKDSHQAPIGMGIAYSARLIGPRWRINNFVNDANHRVSWAKESLAALLSKNRDFDNCGPDKFPYIIAHIT